MRWFYSLADHWAWLQANFNSLVRSDTPHDPRFNNRPRGDHFAWMGDALHKLDVRLALVMEYPDRPTGPLTIEQDRYCSNHAQAEWLLSQPEFSDIPLPSTPAQWHFLGEVFEANYITLLRSRYLSHHFPAHAADVLRVNACAFAFN